MYNLRLIQSKKESDYIALLSSKEILNKELICYVNRFYYTSKQSFDNLYATVELICYLKYNDFTSNIDSLINSFLDDLYKEFLNNPKNLMNLKIFKEPFLSKCFSPSTKEKINKVLDKINLEYKQNLKLFLTKGINNERILDNIYICAPRFEENETNYLLKNALYYRLNPAKKEYLIHAISKMICDDLNFDYDKITIIIYKGKGIKHDTKSNLISIGIDSFNQMDNDIYEFIRVLASEIKSLVIAQTIPENKEDFLSVKNEIYKDYLNEDFLNIYLKEYNIDINSYISSFGTNKANELLDRLGISHEIIAPSLKIGKETNKKNSLYIDLNILSRLIENNDEIISIYPVLGIFFNDNGTLKNESLLLKYEKYLEDIMNLFYESVEHYRNKRLTDFEKKVKNSSRDVFDSLKNASLIKKKAYQLEMKKNSKNQIYNIWGKNNGKSN